MFVAYRYDAALGSKAVIDACRPYDRLAEFPVVAEASRELHEKVKAKWPGLLASRLDGAGLALCCGPRLRNG